MAKLSTNTTGNPTGRLRRNMLTCYRTSGYLILLAALVTVATATQTAFNKNVLHLRLWAVLVAVVLVLIGVVPRIKPSKLGF